MYRLLERKRHSQPKSMHAIQDTSKRPATRLSGSMGAPLAGRPVRSGSKPFLLKPDVAFMFRCTACMRWFCPLRARHLHIKLWAGMTISTPTTYISPTHEVKPI